MDLLSQDPISSTDSESRVALMAMGEMLEAYEHNKPLSIISPHRMTHACTLGGPVGKLNHSPTNNLHVFLRFLRSVYPLIDNEATYEDTPSTIALRHQIN